MIWEPLHEDIKLHRFSRNALNTVPRASSLHDGTVQHVHIYTDGSATSCEAGWAFSIVVQHFGGSFNFYGALSAPVVLSDHPAYVGATAFDAICWALEWSIQAGIQCPVRFCIDRMSSVAVAFHDATASLDRTLTKCQPCPCYDCCYFVPR